VLSDRSRSHQEFAFRHLHPFTLFPAGDRFEDPALIDHIIELDVVRCKTVWRDTDSLESLPLSLLLLIGESQCCFTDLNAPFLCVSPFRGCEKWEGSWTASGERLDVLEKRFVVVAAWGSAPCTTAWVDTSNRRRPAPGGPFPTLTRSVWCCPLTLRGNGGICSFSSADPAPVHFITSSSPRPCFLTGWKDQEGGRKL
jgi:hypothetical protein